MNAVQPQSAERLGVIRTAILGVAALFYAYGVWNAIAYLVTLAQLGLNGFGWFLLLFSAAFPVVVFAIAFALARRRRPGELALTLLAGLALVAVFWLNFVALSTSNFSAVAG